MSACVAVYLLRHIPTDLHHAKALRLQRDHRLLVRLRELREDNLKENKAAKDRDTGNDEELEEWMEKNDFPEDVKGIIRDAIKGKFPTR